MVEGGHLMDSLEFSKVLVNACFGEVCSFNCVVFPFTTTVDVDPQDFEYLRVLDLIVTVNDTKGGPDVRLSMITVMAVLSQLRMSMLFAIYILMMAIVLT